MRPHTPWVHEHFSSLRQHYLDQVKLGIISACHYIHLSMNKAPHHKVDANIVSFVSCHSLDSGFNTV